MLFMPQLQLKMHYWAALLFTYFDAPTADNYTFLVNSDNGAVVWIDGVAVVDAHGKLINLLHVECLVCITTLSQHPTTSS